MPATTQTPATLIQGNTIATPNANVTPAQISAAVASGFRNYTGSSPTSPDKTPTPASSIPDNINAHDLGNSTSYSAPNYTPPSSSNAFVSSLIPPDQGEQTKDSTSSPGENDSSGNNTDPFKRQFSNYFSGLIGKLGTEGDEYRDLQNKYQLPGIASDLANIRGTIAQRTAQYAQQWQMAGTEHAALPYITGEQTQIQRTQAIELGVLSAHEQALTGNLQAANDIVDRTIQHEFDPIKNMLSASAQWYQIHQNDLSDSEKTTFNLNADLTKLTAENFINTKSDAYKTAIQYGASVSTLTALANAKTTTDVYSALSGITTGGNAGGQSGSVINGYDLSTYATDPQYGAKIAQASSTIGTITNVSQAQQIIDATAPNSTVTGEMIATASKTYGVDPNMLASIMKVESNFGTLGVGSRTNNPGNVGNTDSGAITRYKTMQDGVNAVAQQLQNRKVGVQQSITGNPQQNTQKAITATAPILVQPAIRFTSSGTAYIDQGKLDSTSGVMANTWSARTGVPILDNEEVTAVQGLNTAMNNLKSLKTNFDSLAPSHGLFGKIVFKLGSTGHKILDTDYGSALSAYQSNRDNLFQQVSALAGSHPRLNTQELITAANALPKLNEFNTDTIKDGANKVAIVQKYLDNSMKSLLPTYQPAPAPAPTGSIITAPDGRKIQITD